MLTYQYLVVCHVAVFLVGITTGLKVDKDEVEKEWMTKFKQQFETFADNVLGVKQIQNMLKAKDIIQPLDGAKEFDRILSNIQIRYADLQRALNHIRQAIEDPILAPPDLGAPPPAIPMSCCHINKPQRYDGRFRQVIHEGECYGSTDEELKKLVTPTFIDNLKDNYRHYPALTWQYFADTNGHYVQFPASNRLCDNTSKVDSPLIQPWFVEKLHMEKKNVIIVFDIGRATKVPVTSGQPGSRRQLIIEAVRQTLATLTPQDKINLVSITTDSSSPVTTPTQCADRLFIANRRNVELLTDFLKSLPDSDDEPNLMEGLAKAYELLKADMTENPLQFNKASNMVVMVMDGTSRPIGWEDISILEMVARKQGALNNSVQHFVFTLGRPPRNLTDRLALLADQNRLKLNGSSGIPAKPWPNIPGLVTTGQPVGKEGLLKVVETPGNFAQTVSTYFQSLPPQIDTELTTITPVLDKHSGTALTVAVPVYKNGSHDSIVGVAAVDATLAVLFSDVVSFDFGVHSYSFLLETRHGRVLLHPKLRSPGDINHDDTTFPPLEIVEPDLSTNERNKLMSAKAGRHIVTASLRPGRNSLGAESGIKLEKEPATLHYQRVPGTDLVVVMVHFQTDKEEELVNNSTNVPRLHAPYHRLDELSRAPVSNKPNSEDICRLDGNFVSFKESVIKLTPSVFNDPERYKYSKESLNDIVAINRFLVGGDPSSLIRRDLEGEIKRLIERTDGLDTIWKSSSKDVIERFFGSPSGLFRMFPGVPLNNTFDHVKTQWYKKSVTEAGNYVFHRTKLTLLNQNDVIIVSKALASHLKTVNGTKIPERLEGVAGMTVTPRFLTSQLIKMAPGCNTKETQCHLMDRSGMLLDAMLDIESREDRHIVNVYPWLAQFLIKHSLLKFNWCTGLSDGYHKMTFTMVTNASADQSTGEICMQFILAPVLTSNIYLVVLANRNTYSCKDSAATCNSCSSHSFNPLYQLSLARCQHCPYDNSTRCQCSCYCDADFDQCRSQYKTHSASFPTEACYYPPSKVTSQYSQFLSPDQPGPMDGLRRCQQPCVSVEDLTACKTLSHCKVSNDTFPVCVWDDSQTTTHAPTISTLGPTPSVPTPPSKPVVPPYSGGHANPGTQPGLVTTTVMTPPEKMSTTSNMALKQTSTPVSQTTFVTRQTTEYKTTGSGKMTTSKEEGPGLAPGAIAGIVIGLIIMVGVVSFIVIKLYGKKFRRPGNDENMDKYLTRSGLFDSSLFNRSQDSVSVGLAPNSTVPYQGMPSTGGGTA